MTANGAPASGLDYFTPDPNSCGLFIASLSESQMGTWACSLATEGKPYHEAFFAVLPPGELVQDGMRLPTHWVPESYDVKLVPYFEPRFAFDGFVKMNLLANVNSSLIVFHAKDMTIYEEKIAVVTGDDRRLPIKGRSTVIQSNNLPITLNCSIHFRLPLVALFAFAHGNAKQKPVKGTHS